VHVQLAPVALDLPREGGVVGDGDVVDEGHAGCDGDGPGTHHPR